MAHHKTPLKNDKKQLTMIYRKIIAKISLEIPPQLNVPNLFVTDHKSPIIGKREEEKSKRISVAFLLITQLIFYQILSEKQINLPKIQISHLNLAVLIRNFEKAHKITKNPIFIPNIVKLLDKDTYKQLEGSIKEIIILKPEVLQYDVLALIFNTLIPISLRKQIGAYYSGFKTAKLLSHFAIRDPSVKILDPSCGSGALLVASYQRKKELTILKKGIFTDVDHKRFLSFEITGIDIMPFATLLSTIHLALQSSSYEIQQNRLAIYDSIPLNPKSKLQQGFSYIKNSTSKFPQQLDLDIVDLVIMNPPFVRQESLRSIRSSYKDELYKVYEDYSSLISKKISYYCYFLFLADKFLKPGGKVATVIPASFLRVDTTFKIRKWLLKRYNIQYIFCQQDKPNFSEDTAFREILLIATKSGPTNELEYIIIKDLENTESFDQILKSWQKRKITYEDISSNNLFLPIAIMRETNLFKIWRSFSNQKELISIDTFLRSIDSRLKRGIETSGGVKIQNMVINAFRSKYLRPSDLWVFNNETKTHINTINRKTNHQVNIPKACLVPHLRRMSGEKRLDISNKNEYVIILPFSQFKYMNLNENKQKYSLEKLDSWRTYVKERKTNLMIARRFDISASGTSLFSFFSRDKRAPPGVMWSIMDIKDDDAKILCLFFNSTLNLLQIFLNRVETRGAWMQLHNYVIKDLKVPNINNWPLGKRISFYQLYDEIEEKEFPPLWQQFAMNVSLEDITHEDAELLRSQFPKFDQVVGTQFPARKKLDNLFSDCIGIENQNRNESLMREIYLSFLLEIAILKRMM